MYIVALVITTIAIFFSKHFLFLLIFVLSGLNTYIQKPVINTATNKEYIFKGVVLGEDQKDKRLKLRLHIREIIVDKDTLLISLYANHYTFRLDDYLGKTVTIKGRLICGRKPYQPSVIVGAVIDKDYTLSFPGRLFNMGYSYVNKVIRQSVDKKSIPIAQGLVLGGSSRLEPELKNIFSRAGVLHILAVSGLHIGFIIAFIGTFLLPLPVSKKIKFFLIMFFLLFYAGITGFRPSVIRAVLMAFLFGLGYILQRQIDPVHIVNMSALILLLTNPFMLFDIGAQLSFAAVYGIVFLLPVLHRYLLSRPMHTVSKIILGSIATSFSAQLFVSPFLVYYFGQLPTLAVFSNLLIVPLSSIVIYLLFILLILSLVLKQGVDLISFFINHGIWLLEKISALFASLPFSLLSLHISPIFLILFFFIFVKKTRKIAVFSILSLMIIFSLSSLIPISSLKLSENSALITLSNKETILISAGGPGTVHGLEVKEVDYLIAKKRIAPYKKEFIPFPDDLQYKNIKIGDFVINLDKDPIIFGGNMKFSLPCAGYDNRIKSIILGKKKIFEFESYEDSILDDILNDLKFLIGRLIVGF